MVLIVGDKNAVNIEIEELKEIVIEYKCVYFLMKNKERHIFNTNDPKSFFDHACTLLKPKEP